MKNLILKETLSHYVSEWKKYNWLTLDLETGEVGFEGSSKLDPGMSNREEEGIMISFFIPLKIDPSVLL